MSADGRNVTACRRPRRRAPPTRGSPTRATARSSRRCACRVALFDVAAAAVTALSPRGRPVDGGTRVTLHGRSFGSYPAACLFGDARGGGERPRRRRRRVRGAGAARRPRRRVARTSLNGGTSALRRAAASGVPFTYYRRAGDRYAQGAAEVRIASMTPLGGPAAGGTLVTVRGAGFVDRGGVYCRFGRSAEDKRVEAAAVLRAAASAAQIAAATRRLRRRRRRRWCRRRCGRRPSSCASARGWRSTPEPCSSS